MEKGLDRFSKLDIFVYCGKVEEGCDYIKEESARVAPMLAIRLFQSKSEHSSAERRDFLLLRPQFSLN